MPPSLASLCHVSYRKCIDSVGTSQCRCNLWVAARVHSRVRLGRHAQPLQACAHILNAAQIPCHALAQTKHSCWVEVLHDALWLPCDDAPIPCLEVAA